MDREMFVVGFVKKELAKLISHVNSQSINKGYKMLANKGCLALCLTLNGKTFNFIGGHLAAFENKIAKGEYNRYMDRNKMMSEVIHEAKINPLQTYFKGLECDTIADYSIMAGDFNYRMLVPDNGKDSEKISCDTFAEMLKTDNFKQYLKEWN